MEGRRTRQCPRCLQRVDAACILQHFTDCLYRAATEPAFPPTSTLPLPSTSAELSERRQMYPSTSCPNCGKRYSSDCPPLVLRVCGHSACSQCLQSLRQAAIICPLCSENNGHTHTPLPVNFALLELSECHSVTGHLCSIHGLELFAFCSDDYSLLCGVCIFSHKSHQSFLIESQEAMEFVEARKAFLQQCETELELRKREWEETDRELAALVEVVTHSAQHLESRLHSSETNLLHRISTGRVQCEQELHSADCDLQRLQSKCRATANQVQKEVERVRTARKEFERMSVGEKIKVGATRGSEDYGKPPLLSRLLRLSALLSRKCSDYEAAILKRSLFT